MKIRFTSWTFVSCALFIQGCIDITNAANLRLPRAIYDEAEAYSALAYSSAASCDNLDVLLNWSCKICTDGAFPVPKPPPLTSVEVIEDPDEVTQGVIGYDASKQRIVVSFQGSKSFDQWLLDFNIIKTHVDNYCSECEVHSGFYSAFERVADQLLNTITTKATAFGTNDIFFVGHSLGAAISTHTALNLKLQYGNAYDISGYTFGQPRVGNNEFAVFFHEHIPNFFRVTNYRDPVPVIIFDSWGYWHSPQEVWYPNEPKPGVALSPNSFIILDPEDGEDQTGINSVCKWYSPCINGDHHVTYMNHPDMSDESLIC